MQYLFEIGMGVSTHVISMLKVCMGVLCYARLGLAFEAIYRISVRLFGLVIKQVLL